MGTLVMSVLGSVPLKTLRKLSFAFSLGLPGSLGSKHRALRFIAY